MTDNSSVLKAATRLLKSRSYHSAQINSKLLRSGFDPKEVTDCLKYLRTNQFINDALFLETQILNKLEKGFSQSHILHKLKAKEIPVPAELIASVANQYQINESSQIDSITAQFTGKKELQMRDLTRLYRLLLSKGHNADIVQEKIISLQEDCC